MDKNEAKYIVRNLNQVTGFMRLVKKDPTLLSRIPEDEKWCFYQALEAVRNDMWEVEEALRNA